MRGLFLTSNRCSEGRKWLATSSGGKWVSPKVLVFSRRSRFFIGGTIRVFGRIDGKLVLDSSVVGGGKEERPARRASGGLA